MTLESDITEIVERHLKKPPPYNLQRMFDELAEYLHVDLLSPEYETLVEVVKRELEKDNG